MTAITYLFFTTIKNSIKELRKKPGKLVLLLLVAVLIGFSLVGGNAGASLNEMRDPRELEAILFAFYLVMAVMLILQGLQSGATFYTMPDVNLLFQTPVHPTRVLVYGLVRQMGTSLLMGFFLLFQYTTLHVWYGVSIGGLLLIFVTYGVAVFCAQLTTMLLYIFTAGNEKRQKAVKAGIALLCGGLAAWVLVPAFGSEAPLAAIVNAASVRPLDLFPIAGWTKAAAAAAFGGGAGKLLIGFGAAAVYCLGFILLITRAHVDFYEDVLQATEVSFNTIAAKKEGRIQTVPTKVKVGKTGLGGGSGSAVFFYKNQLEDRRAKSFLLDGTSLLMAAMILIVSWFVRGSGLLPIFALGIYCQIFSTMAGRWIRELTLPYVYLIPEPPAKKLWMLCRQNLLKVAVDALIVMLPAGLVLGAPAAEIAAAIAARAGFGVLFMAGTILNERLFGGMTNKILVMIFYLLVMLTIAAPGIVLGTIVGMTLGGSLAAGLLVTLGWNILCSAAIMYLCRGLLDNAET